MAAGIFINLLQVLPHQRQEVRDPPSGRRGLPLPSTLTGGDAYVVCPIARSNPYNGYFLFRGKGSSPWYPACAVFGASYLTG